MTRPYRLTPVARAQLRRSFLYSLNEFGDQQTDRYFSGLRKTLERIATFPDIGTAIHPGSRVRTFPYQSHVICYRETSRGVEIGRIYSAAQGFAQRLSAYERDAGRQAARDRPENRDREPDRD